MVVVRGAAVIHCILRCGMSRNNKVSIMSAVLTSDVVTVLCGLQNMPK